MKKETFKISMYAYPWDLADEGLDVSLGRIKDLARCDEILLTPCYHRGDYLLPHHPIHPIYFGEPGAIYYEPEAHRYGTTSIRPIVSGKVNDVDYFESIVAGITGHGLQFGAWVVYANQDQLVGKYPHFARQDAFGISYNGQLSLFPCDVREYFFALTKEVMDRFAPKSVFIESLGRQGFPVPPKRQVEIDLRCQYLLSLCFHPSSIALVNEAGMDGDYFQKQVREYVQSRLENANKTDMGDPASSEWVDTAFDGLLRIYLQITRASVADLWQKIVEIIHDAGAEVHMSPVNEARFYGNDLEYGLNRFCDRVCYEPLGKMTSTEVEALRENAGVDAKVLFYWDRHFESQEEATATLSDAIEAGCDGATVYNYGLLTARQLQNVGAASATLLS